VRPLDLLVGTAHAHGARAVGLGEHPPVAAPDTHVHLAGRQRKGRVTEPAAQVRRLGHRPPNLVRWRVEVPADDEDGEDPPGSAIGAISLYHGDAKVGEGRIQTQPGKFSLTGDGLCVGRDSADPVTDDYAGSAPWAFPGGTIKRVAIDVSGEPYLDLEREAVAMMSRE
jgi:hypothetical protein